MMWKEAVLRRFEEHTHSRRSVAGRIEASTWPRMCVVIREASRNVNSNTMEPDRPPHDRPAASFIAQQYSSLSFISSRSHCWKEKFGAIKRSYYINYFLNF